MKKLGMFVSLFACMCLASVGYAQQDNVVAPVSNNVAPQNNYNNYQGSYGYDQHGYYNGSQYNGGYADGAPCEQPCAPADQPMHDCYCKYVKYEPCYYNKWNCTYCPKYTYKKCCRYVSQPYQKQCCRYVPQYYCETCYRQVPQYYYTCQCTQVPKYSCEKCCKYVPKYYYKHVCEPTCTPESCVAAPQ